MKKMNKNQKGFTLIELLISVAIVMTLAVVAMPIYTSFIEKAKFLEVQNKMKPIKTWMEVEGRRMSDLMDQLNDTPDQFYWLGNHNFGMYPNANVEDINSSLKLPVSGGMSCTRVTQYINQSSMPSSDASSQTPSTCSTFDMVFPPTKKLLNHSFENFAFLIQPNGFMILMYDAGCHGGQDSLGPSCAQFPASGSLTITYVKGNPLGSLNENKAAPWKIDTDSSSCLRWEGKSLCGG